MIWAVLRSTRSLNFSVFKLIKSGFDGSLLVVLFMILTAFFLLMLCEYGFGVGSFSVSPHFHTVFYI